MKRTSIFILLIMLLGNSGCSAQGNQHEFDDKITVVVSVVPEATFVEKVAGDLVKIVTVIPTGNSPANYQPTTIKMQEISEADIYFVMQVPTEEANILFKMQDFNKDIIIVNLRDAVGAEYPLRHLDENHDDEEGVIDPHIWVSPKRAVVIVQTIADELSAIDTVNADFYQKNAEHYISRLNALDEEIQQAVNKMSNKSFMIYHGAYGYFAEDYGLNMISLEVDGKAATAARIQKVVDQAVEEGIRAIFYQDEFDGHQAKTIAQEIDGVVMRTSPLSADYIKNIRELVNALSDNGE